MLPINPYGLWQGFLQQPGNFLRDRPVGTLKTEDSRSTVVFFAVQEYKRTTVEGYEKKKSLLNGISVTICASKVL